MGAGHRVFISVETSAFSGATLLAFLLGTHPRIVTIGEMDGLIPRENPDTYLCSCGQRIKKCEFWQAVDSAMQDRGFEFDVAHFDTGFALPGGRLVQRLRGGSFRNHVLDSLRDALFLVWPQEKRYLEPIVARNEAFVNSVLDVGGGSVFVDTSKNLSRFKYLSRLSSFDTRAIHLVRDVRGVVASRLKRGLAVDARQAARDWVRTHQRIESTLHALPEQKRMVLRYEDLCQDPNGTLARIHQFCQVVSHDEQIDWHSVTQHIVGNAMRLREPSEIKLDERWKIQLTKSQLSEIASEAARFGHRYGYEGGT